MQPLYDRKKSFLKAVGRLSNEITSATAAGSDSPDGGRQAMRNLLELGFIPTAVVCVNDFMALGVLKLLRERGLRVPEDVSVVGHDNIHLSEFAYPPLTTVNVPRDRIGHSVCAALLAERCASSIRGVVIEPELIVRDSTGPAPRTQATLALHSPVGDGGDGPGGPVTP